MIYDVEVVKLNPMNNHRTPRGSGDPRGLLETHRGFFSVQEHLEETSIYEVEVVESKAMKNQEHREDLVIRGVFLIPLNALLEPSCGPLGALSVPTPLTY